MDIKETVEKIISEVKNDPNLLEEFKKDPTKTAEKITGADLPDGVLEKVVATLSSSSGELDKILDTVESKITPDTIGDAIDAIKKIL